MSVTATTSYFIRQGDNVQGPFPREKIRSLAHAGSLRPEMEISRDRVSWQRAGDVPGLFDHPAYDGSAAEAPTPPAKTARGNRFVAMFGAIVGLVAGGIGLVQFFGNRLPSELALINDVAKELEPKIAFFADIDRVAALPHGNSERVALAARIRRESIPAFEAARSKLGADADTEVVQRYVQLLDAQIALNQDSARWLEEATEGSIDVDLAQAVRRVEQAGTAYWEAIPAKHRVAQNPWASSPATDFLGG